jgi:hypothetical protein
MMRPRPVLRCSREFDLDGMSRLPLTVLDYDLHLEEKTMKKIQLLCASVVLTLLLSVCAFADDGVILMGKDNPPPPPPPSASSTAQSDAADTDGIMSTGAPVADAVREAASAVLQGVLALF